MRQKLMNIGFFSLILETHRNQVSIQTFQKPLIISQCSLWSLFFEQLVKCIQINYLVFILFYFCLYFKGLM